MTTNFLIFGLLLVLAALAFLLRPLLQSRRSAAIAVFLIFATPGLTWLIYSVVGTPAALYAENLQPPQTQQNHQSDGQQSMDEAIVALKAELQTNPDNIEGWLLLGRTLLTVNQPAEAVNAYRRALALEPGDAYTKMELADAILRTTNPAQQQGFPAEVKTLLEEAYASNPELQKAQWLLGIAAASEGNHQRALDLWQDLLAKLEPGSAIATTVTEQIDQARAALGVEAPTAADPVDTGIALNINVQLAEPAIAAANPQALVFVFLKVPGQTGMPLAVKRLTAGQLPLNLQLTDADILQPGKSLSEFSQLLLSAKLSATGTANVDANDLQAEPITINTADNKPIKLLLK
ncbi:MAG: tetratricopeptide repeat protein [Proteobacteria bacterium]|nr:tetratricopeptide repeat protein [Pseudomonadota bacterium]